VDDDPDDQSDELPTELSWQRFVRRKSPIFGYTARAFNPTFIWRLRWEWPSLGFGKIFATRKLESLGYRDYGTVCVIPRLVVSVEHRLLTDGQLERQTPDDTYTQAS